MSPRSILPFCVLIALAACSHALDENQEPVRWVRVVGRIDAGPPGSQAALRTPDTVSAGSTFTIGVSTYGSTACIRPDRSAVQLGPSAIDVTVYDSFWVSGRPPCLPDWHEYPRTVELQFDAAGPAVIRLHGRGADSALTFERSVTVRP